MKKRTRCRIKELTRALLLSMLLLAFSKPGNAQFEYGIKLGAGAACQSDLLEIANNRDLKFSPLIGFVGKYHLTNGFALKSGLEYIQKGRKIEENAIVMNDKLHYLNIPVKAEFSAGEKAGFKNNQRIYFAMGPYFSYLVDANSTGDAAQYRPDDLTKDYDFGLGFEIGFEFPAFTGKKIQLGVNYDMGLIEVYTKEEYKDLHNKMASISLALLF